jgi:hypothetical protein
MYREMPTLRDSILPSVTPSAKMLAPDCECDNPSKEERPAMLAKAQIWPSHGKLLLVAPQLESCTQGQLYQLVSTWQRRRASLRSKASLHRNC